MHEAVDVEFSISGKRNAARPIILEILYGPLEERLKRPENRM